ncbi:HAD phosphatase, family IIIA protein [Lyngbya aestuarii BL J]|uniref:HAD phosphatase, family IIIA protein n=1 Tax=Lyngbya aestuarii BL J TaxID=1348334 RepID=U7QA02_9CYAN|nr:YqeG family HAD IIIA-type phosphatase [Lyngbya aestuarii]ERT04648.1 HAD phosphatase, family IIIA protein [Lyngbya aestuarii BL J]
MTWGNLLQPDLILGDSVTGLKPEILEQNRLRGLLLDVDETLLPITRSQVSEELHQWIETIRPLVSVWLVSNNISQPRISAIANALNLPYISGAGKPSRRKVRRAVDAMNLPISQIGMVGDRLFTDVLVGNRLGMFTILVEPMLDSTPGSTLYSMRSLEVWLSNILGASLKLD